MYTDYVFDIDGTMIDTEQVCLDALKMLLKSRLGRDYTDEDCRWSLGIPSEKVLPYYGLARTDDLMAEWDGYYEDTIARAAIFAGVTETLEELKKRGARLGIITSRDTTEMEYDPYLQKLLPYFDLVVTAACTTEHKPTPAPMRYYLERSGARPEQTLYIGDTAYDCQCAKGAGVDFALAVWGARDWGDIRADFFPRTPAEILSLGK